MTLQNSFQNGAAVKGTERQTAPEHFIDLCHVLVVMVRHRREVYR